MDTDTLGLGRLHCKLIFTWKNSVVRTVFMPSANRCLRKAFNVDFLPTIDVYLKHIFNTMNTSRADQLHPLVALKFLSMTT